MARLHPGWVWPPHCHSVYFATILAGTLLSYQSFVATLVNKKLVSASKGANIIAAGGFIELIIFVQLLFAKSLYGQ